MFFKKNFKKICQPWCGELGAWLSHISERVLSFLYLLLCSVPVRAQQSFSAKRKKKQNKSKATFDLKWLSESTSALCISYRRVCQQSGYCLASLGLLISTLLWPKSLMDAHWPWKISQRLEGRGSSLLGVFIMWKNVFFSFLFCSVLSVCGCYANAFLGLTNSLCKAFG